MMDCFLGVHLLRMIKEQVTTPDHWHHGSAFAFYVGDCPFKSKPTPTSADACREVIGCNAGCQEVGKCSTRGGSQKRHITFTSAKVNKAEHTLALQPRGDVTRNPKQGYQNGVSAKNIKKRTGNYHLPKSYKRSSKS